MDKIKRIEDALSVLTPQLNSMDQAIRHDSAMVFIGAVRQILQSANGVECEICAERLRRQAEDWPYKDI